MYNGVLKYFRRIVFNVKPNMVIKPPTPPKLNIFLSTIDYNLLKA